MLSLISALSNTSNHTLHVQAIHARDEALASSLETYQQLCWQLALTLAGSENYQAMLSRMDPIQLENWRRTDPQSVSRLQQDAQLWVPFGQMAGLLLKDALLRPPQPANDVGNPSPHRFSLEEPVAIQMQSCLLNVLGSRHSELRSVASSIIATLAVAPWGTQSGCVQPWLHLKNWKTLIPTLVSHLQSGFESSSESFSPTNLACLEGSLQTVRKIMEDGPQQLDQEELDTVIPVLLQLLQLPTTQSTSPHQLASLQSLAACLSHSMMPSALVLHFGAFLQGLSQLATQTSYSSLQQWVCRTMVTLLALRTEFVEPHVESICRFMLSATASASRQGAPATEEQRLVALEACEFWLTWAHMEEEACTANMSRILTQLILPELIPVLLQCMVYHAEQQEELLLQNQFDIEESRQQAMRPVFHRSKALRTKTSSKHVNHSDDLADDDDGDGCVPDDDEEDIEDANEWTLRKCAAASLDSLASVYGADPILPHLIPALERGLQSADPWIQEASVLALGAVAEGCSAELSSSLPQLFPYLLQTLALPEDTQTALPQLKCICAWTIGRYSHWAVEEIHSGSQQHLLSQLTEVFMTRLGDCNHQVQVACCSAFGVVIEAAGDLLVPHLEVIFKTLIVAMSRYQGRSLLMVFDLLGIVADSCGPAIAEGDLLSLFVPPLLELWNGAAKRDPADRTMLPLMECLASIAVSSGIHFQQYALLTYENAMAIIDAVKLMIVATSSGHRNHPTIRMNDEDADPITCATDLLDGLVESLGSSFHALVSSSSHFGPPAFLMTLHSLLCHNDYVTAGVQMSALALLGDLARHTPALLEPVLPQLLQEAIQALDPTIHHASVCTNAVWAIGEIFVKFRTTPEEGTQTLAIDAVLGPLVPTIMQKLIALLSGNGIGLGNRCVDIPGLAENAAACVGRLALVNPNYVAPELPRFLLGWCEGLSKIVDPAERRDGFLGFLAAMYANPLAIQSAVGAQSRQEAIVCILFAVVSWHLPENSLNDAEESGDPLHCELLHGPEYRFIAFPEEETALKAGLERLVGDLKASVGEDSWSSVEKGLPVNLRQLLRNVYNL